MRIAGAVFALSVMGVRIARPVQAKKSDRFLGIYLSHLFFLFLRGCFFGALFLLLAGSLNARISRRELALDLSIYKTESFL